MHRLADPQQWNIYAYARNNPLKFTDPDGLDIACTGSRCDDYLKALGKDVSFKIDYDKNGKVVTVGDIYRKGLSKSDKAFLNAIDDTVTGHDLSPEILTLFSGELVKLLAGHVAPERLGGTIGNAYGDLRV